MVAAAVVGSAVVGGVVQGQAAKSAAKKQAAAADRATQAQQGMFNATQENLQPYMDSGNAANNLFQAQLPRLSSPVQLNQTQLQQTPGYQFNLAQGLRATQNAAAARGLGTSGAALKGAAQFATGLADSTYQNQFNNALQNKQQSYNMLSDATKVGANAAAGLGQVSSTVGGNIAGTMQNAGNAQAAGTLGQANAVAGGLNGLQSAFYANKILGGDGGNSGLYQSSNLYNVPESGYGSFAQGGYE